MSDFSGEAVSINRAESFDIPEINRFCEYNPFGTAIITLIDAYGIDSGLFTAYIQRSGTGIAAVMSYFSGEITLLACEKADFSLLKDFFLLLRPKKIFTSLESAERLDLPIAVTGEVMCYSGAQEDFINSDSRLLGSEELKGVFEVIFEQEKRENPEFAAFYTDLSHRVRHSLTHIFAVCENGRPVSVAMSVSRSAKTAVIGFVCTKKTYRERGFARANVQALTKFLTDMELGVYLYCDENSPVNLYKSLHFTLCSKWAALYL